MDLATYSERALGFVRAARSPLPARGERSDRVSDPGEGDSQPAKGWRPFSEPLQQWQNRNRRDSRRVPLTRPRFTIARRTRRAFKQQSKGLWPSAATSPRKRGEVTRCTAHRKTLALRPRRVR